MDLSILMKLITEFQNINTNQYIINIFLNNYIWIIMFILYQTLKIVSKETKWVIDDKIYNLISGWINKIKNKKILP